MARVRWSWTRPREHVTYIFFFLLFNLFGRRKSCAQTYGRRRYVGRWRASRVRKNREKGNLRNARQPSVRLNLRAASVVENAHSRSARKMAGKWNGGWERGRGARAKDCSRRIEKVTRLPGADNHLRLPFARASNPFIPTLLCHIRRWVFISLPSRPRDTGLKNRDTFQAATSNAIPSSLRELIRESGTTVFFSRAHTRDVEYLRRMQQWDVRPGINSFEM